MKEGSQLSDKFGQLKLPADDGKLRLTDVADTKQIFRLIQSIPSPKAEPSSCGWHKWPPSAWTRWPIRSSPSTVNWTNTCGWATRRIGSTSAQGGTNRKEGGDGAERKEGADRWKVRQA